MSIRKRGVDEHGSALRRLAASGFEDGDETGEVSAGGDFLDTPGHNKWGGDGPDTPIANRKRSRATPGGNNKGVTLTLRDQEKVSFVVDRLFP